MRTVILSAFFLIFMISSVMAQTTRESKIKNKVLNSGGILVDDSEHLYITVLDSLTESLLEGAVITIVNKKDTIVRSMLSGSVRFNRTFKDSVSITVTYLGYKSFQKTFSAKEMYGAYDILMVEDPLEIAEVVVVGKSLAMIIRGDTVIYDANRFSALVGDNLGELIQQMPGLEYKDGVLTFNGEPISRITIEGKRLFGGDIEAALKNIYAEDVDGIEVYKQQSDAAKHFGLKDVPLEQVMNVKTKREINIVKNMTIALEAGQGMSKNRNFDEGVIHHEEVSANLFSEIVQVKWHFNHRKNLSTRQNARGPNELYNAILSLGYSNKGINLLSFNSFKQNIMDIKSFTARDYFPTDQYLSRIYNHSNLSTTKDRMFNSSNSFNLMRGNHNATVKIDLNLKDNTSRYRAMMSDITDGAKVLNTDRKSYDKWRDFTVNVSLEDSYYLKNKSSITVFMNGSRGCQDGDGWRVDTTATTIFRTYLTNDVNGKNNLMNGSISYRIPLAESWSISMFYGIDYSDSKSQRISYDHLLFRTDTLNTYDYTLESVENRGGIGFSADHKSLNFSVNIRFSNKHVIRDERFPGNYEFPRVFNTLLPSFDLNYSFSPVKRLGIKYSSSAPDISIEELRGVIDDRNPLMLKAGNPRLKQPMGNTFAATYNIFSPRSGSSFEIKIQGAYMFNYIAYKTRYFVSETDHYWGFDYPFRKGTTFMIPDNVGGRWEVKTGFEFKKRSESLRSTLCAELTYDYLRLPYFLDETVHVRLVNGGSLILGFISGFSNKVSLSINSTSGVGTTNSLNGDSWYFNQGLTTNLRMVVKRKYTFNTRANYNYSYYSSEPDFIRNEVVWNAELGRKFGKENRLELTAKVFDILDKTDNRRVNIVDNYIQTSTSWFLGRFWTIEMKYKF